MELAYLLSRGVPAGECRLWTGSTRNGYGRVWEDGEEGYAHIEAFKLYNPDVEMQPGDKVCHSCDTPSCIAEGHLFKGTAAANSADMVAKGRSLKGARHPAARLTPEQVAEIKSTPKGYGSGTALARKFGVAKTTISMIRCDRTWKE